MLLFLVRRRSALSRCERRQAGVTASLLFVHIPTMTFDRSQTIAILQGVAQFGPDLPQYGEVRTRFALI